MIEPKISLNLLVPGAGMLSSQECEKKPKENYDVHKVHIEYTKGSGKSKKRVKEVLVVKTRKPTLVSQHINICKDAYDEMLSTPTSSKLAKPIKFNKNGEVIQRVWDKLTIDERLRHHFDQIAHDFRAASYSYEILSD